MVQKAVRTNRELFIAGSLDSFVEHEALKSLTSGTSYFGSEEQMARKFPDLSSEEISDIREAMGDKYSVPNVASRIYTSLASRQNPLNDPVISKSLDFENTLSYYDSSRPEDSYDIHRAISIALSDSSPEHASLRNSLSDGTTDGAMQAMHSYLRNAVNMEIKARLSSVSLNACLDTPPTQEVSLASVIKQFKEQITNPFEQSMEFQRSLPVDMAAMHEVKREILTDFSNVNFLENYGARLDKCDMSSDSIGNILSMMEQQHPEMKSSVAHDKLMNLYHKSAYTFDKSPHSLFLVDLPRSEMELAGLFARESIDFTSDAFKNEVLREKMELNGFELGIRSFSEPVSKPKESLESQNLAELLKNSTDMSGPSM